MSGGCRRAGVGAGGGDEPLDQLLPCSGRRQRQVERLEQQEAEADGVAEGDERIGVELLVDATARLGRLDDVGEARPAIVDAPSQELGDLRITSRGDERLQQERPASDRGPASRAESPRR